MKYRKSKVIGSFCRLNDDGSMLEVTNYGGSTLVILDLDMSHRVDVVNDEDWEDTTQEEFEKAHSQAVEDIQL